jgi:preprotein translocase subunit SecF
LLPLVAIFIFGGATLKYFSLALIIGFAAGAYSSIFVASTSLVWWREYIQAKAKSKALSEPQDGSDDTPPDSSAKSSL